MIPGFGAVVLCHGPESQEQVNALVAELLRQGVEPGSVTIVRNPSHHDTSLDAPAGEIPIIQPDRNLGYAGGMNLGMEDQLQKGRHLMLLLTMDVRLEPGAVDRMCDSARRSGTFGLLGPELRWRGTDRTSWGMRWGPTGAVEHILTRPEDADKDGIVECDAIDGSAVLVRSEVVQAIGPLTDRLFMYFEETEFCLRAKRAGWRVGVVLGAVGEQASGESRRPGAFNYLMARNGLEFARLVAGRRGVAAALSRDLAQSWRLLKMRFSPHSDSTRRRFATTSLTGLWHGVMAYFRNRWGPPPADLPGLGDVTVAG